MSNPALLPNGDSKQPCSRTEENHCHSFSGLNVVYNNLPFAPDLSCMLLDDFVFLFPFLFKCWGLGVCFIILLKLREQRTKAQLPKLISGTLGVCVMYYLCQGQQRIIKTTDVISVCQVIYISPGNSPNRKPHHRPQPDLVQCIGQSGAWCLSTVDSPGSS